MITPQDIRQAKRALGAQLAALSKAAGLRQEDLANAVHLSRSSIANTEIGHQVSAKDFWERCDELLRADGNLIQAYERVRDVEAHYRQHHVTAGSRPDSVIPALATTVR
ncbi:helix-turn-helix domain-containing protein [Allorhizocola rhizosphaerae]|uniref:helix-turn-helix domain-containing protein n=1 Tax=Allorhizocola rhizosphaerae TaxID=1872709 RepID=UPI0013C2BAEF|nr:helix-turn-helix transcriptional regulator [Allorhizocola rhizosphaerae]